MHLTIRHLGGTDELVHAFRSESSGAGRIRRGCRRGGRWMQQRQEAGDHHDSEFLGAEFQPGATHREKPFADRR